MCPTRHYIILVTWILLLLQNMQNSDALKQPYNISKLNTESFERLFSISSSAPASRQLLQSPQLRAKMAPAFDLIIKLADVGDSRQESHNRIACNLHRQTLWVVLSLISVRVQQVGTFPELCQSSISFNEEIISRRFPEHFGRTAKQTLANARKAGFDAIVASGVLPSRENPAHNWTNGAHNIAGWSMREHGQVCTLDSLFAYRVEEMWYIRVEATNNAVDAFMPDWHRQVIYEHIGSNFTSTIRLPHRDFYTHEVVLGTTLLQRWQGTAPYSSMGPMLPKDNPALSEAQRLSALAVAHAADALTLSNVAILALPMGMSLIPVAFVTEVGTWGMLWYTVFTDVFSTIPFLIMGVELMQIGSKRQGETAAYMVGNKTLGQMEVWSAECGGDESFFAIGVAFVCVAIVAMVVGVLLEFAAHVIMQRRRSTEGSGTEGDFAGTLLDRLAYSPLGSATEAEQTKALAVELQRKYPNEWRQIVEKQMRMKKLLQQETAVGGMETPGAGPFSSAEEDYVVDYGGIESKWR